jgi:hypothetical protein
VETIVAERVITANVTDLLRRILPIIDQTDPLLITFFLLLFPELVTLFHQLHHIVIASLESSLREEQVVSVQFLSERLNNSVLAQLSDETLQLALLKSLDLTDVHNLDLYLPQSGVFL